MGPAIRNAITLFFNHSLLYSHSLWAFISSDGHFITAAALNSHLNKWRALQRMVWPLHRQRHNNTQPVITARNSVCERQRTRGGRARESSGRKIGSHLTEGKRRGKEGVNTVDECNIKTVIWCRDASDRNVVLDSRKRDTGRSAEKDKEAERRFAVRRRVAAWLFGCLCRAVRALQSELETFK